MAASTWPRHCSSVRFPLLERKRRLASDSIISTSPEAVLISVFGLVHLDAHELLKKAAELRASARSSLSNERVAELNSLAKTMADDFQRSSSMVEGRNGALSLRHHAFHELSPLKRKVLTVMHNFVTLRADGTTAGERFSGVKPKCLITWLCERIKTLPQAGGKRILCKAS